MLHSTVTRRFFQATLGAAVSFVIISATLAGGSPARATPLGINARPGPAGSSGQCATDVYFLGFSDALDKTTFAGFNVAELSGLAYDESDGGYYAVADRAGPVQTHVFSLDIPFAASGPGTPAVTSATILSDPDGTAYTGLSFDAEGIVAHGTGWIVASEGGSASGQQPEIREFDGAGNELGSLEVPARFLVGTNNLTFESLALSPNGHSLFTANEAPLAVDGRTADLRSRIRIVRYDNREGGRFVPVEEYFYLTEPGRTTGDVGVADMIALSETEVLVLERGFVAGQGNTIRIFRVSLRASTEVSSVDSLASLGVVEEARALAAKQLLVDVVNCPSGGATTAPGATQPNPLLENFEAMTLGPRLPGGYRALVLLSDDNLSAGQTTRVVALAVWEPRLVGNDAFVREDTENP